MAEELNPFVMVRRAAGGDLDAQRELASGAAACLADQDIIGFWEGLTYARMAAAQGNATDKALVITLLDLGACLLDPKDAAGQAGYAGQMTSCKTRWLAVLPRSARHSGNRGGARSHLSRWTKPMRA